jgi:NitT/TauT family transport system permease protein
LGRDLFWSVLSLLFCGGLLVAVWEAVSLSGSVSTIVLPTPLQVAQTFGSELVSGDLLSNTAVTLEEALYGFLLAFAVASVLGYAIEQVRALELLTVPFIAAAQGVPAVAVAPIIILAAGFGLAPKVLICAAVVVFPLLVSTVTALRGIPREYRDIARVFGASRLQMLRSVEVPLAAPVLLSGVKLGLTLSITGAVVGEFVASDAGLGYMVNVAQNSFDASSRYVAVISLGVLSTLLFGGVTVFERMVQEWLGV